MLLTRRDGNRTTHNAENFFCCPRPEAHRNHVEIRDLFLLAPSELLSAETNLSTSADESIRRLKETRRRLRLVSHSQKGINK